MSFKLSATRPDKQPIHYRLALEPQGIGYEIADEMLYLQGPEPPFFKYIEAQHGVIRYLVPEDTRSSPQQLKTALGQPDLGETALSQDPARHEDPVEFRRGLTSTAYYHALDVSPRSPVRLPQPMRPASLPGADGEDLVSCLYSLRETDGDRFEAVADTLKAGFPGFERLDFPPVAAGTLAMTWKDKNFKQPLYMHQLSEGTLPSCGWRRCCTAPACPPLRSSTSRKSASTRNCSASWPR